jgi:DNA-directed RNA polymerase subunit M/transcription elongation factor TFIIS
MTIPTTWAADEPCPDCGAALILLEDGGSPRTECRTCGHCRHLDQRRSR